MNLDICRGSGLRVMSQDSRLITPNLLRDVTGNRIDIDIRNRESPAGGRPEIGIRDRPFDRALVRSAFDHEVIPMTGPDRHSRIDDHLSPWIAN